LDQVPGRIGDPGIGRGNAQVAVVESFVLGGAVVVNGDDDHLASGRTVVGRDGDPGGRYFRAADSHITRADELAVVAEAVETLGGVAAAVAKSLIVGIQVDQPPVIPGVEIVVHDAAVERIGVVEPAVDVAVAGFFGEFGLPAFDGVARRGGIAGRNRIRAAAVQVNTDNFHVFRRVRVPHGGGSQVQIVREGLRHHDDVGEASSLEGRTQVGPDECVKRRSRPKTSIVTGVVVGLVLDGDRVRRKTVGVLASGGEARDIGGVGGVVRGIKLVGATARVATVTASVVAIDGVVVLPLRRRAPGAGEDSHIRVDGQRLLRRIAGRAPVGVAGVVDLDAKDREPDIAVDLAGGRLAGIVRPKLSSERRRDFTFNPNASRSETRNGLISSAGGNRYVLRMGKPEDENPKERK
jgi:hypothetical protein